MPEKATYDRNQWNLVGNGQQWTLTETGFIETDDPYGILDEAGDSDVRVFGWIHGQTVDDSLTVGVSLNMESSLTIGKEGWISGFTYGIDFSHATEVTNQGAVSGITLGAGSEAGGTFINQGVLEGGSWGIVLGEAAIAENSGFMRGGIAGVIVNADDTQIDNEAGGRIVGGFYGIKFGGFMPSLDALADPVHATINNAGTIRALGLDAIDASGATSINLRNTGKIIGDVVLGDLGNTVDTRGGEIRGSIIGGDAADTYKISSKIDIQDFGSATGDWVISTVSFTLIGGLDDLTLKGKANINGKGNIGHNDLIGNDGKNRLQGFEGNDILEGGRGNDTLEGGAGSDQFMFAKGFGSDRIEDFELIDFIGTAYVETLKDFKRLDIRQMGDDAVIDFGHGDKLRLVDFEKSDLSFDLFNLN